MGGLMDVPVWMDGLDKAGLFSCPSTWWNGLHHN